MVTIFLGVFNTYPKFVKAFDHLSHPGVALSPAGRAIEPSLDAQLHSQSNGPGSQKKKCQQRHFHAAPAALHRRCGSHMGLQGPQKSQQEEQEKKSQQEEQASKKNKEKKSQQEEQEKKSQQEEQEKKSQQTNIAMPRSFAWPQRHSPALRLCSPTGQRTQSGQAFLDVRRCLQPQIDHSASNLSKKAARYQKEQQVWLLTLAHSSLCLLSARKSGAVPHPVVSQSQTAYSRKITQTSHTKHIPNTDTYQTRTLNTRTHTDKNSCKEPQEARRPPHKAWNLQSLGG